MIKIIIDIDPGIDDVMVIFYVVVVEDIDLLGLIVIFGNVIVDIVICNVL